jgi:hypothetical protein
MVMAVESSAAGRMQLPEFGESDMANNDSFLLECQRSGLEPRRAYESLVKIRWNRAMRGRPDEQAASLTLTEEDTHILEAYADAQFLPRAAAHALAKDGRVEMPAGVDPVDHCHQLLRSALRKKMLSRGQEMTSDETAAHARYIEWVKSGDLTPEAAEEIEVERLAVMPSVIVLTADTFDEAFKAFPEPTIVYFHKPRIGVPDACLRMERLAQEFRPYGRVARVDLLPNYDLARRFMIILKPEPLLLFDLNGSLKGYLSAEESYEAIAAWFEPQVARMRRMMTDPQKAAQLEMRRAEQLRFLEMQTGKAA